MAASEPLDPDELRAAETVFEPRRGMLKELARSLEARVEELLEAVPHVDRVSFRAKKPSSFAAKSLATEEDGSRKYKHPLIEIEDQVAGRVLVFFRADMLAVLERLKPVFNAIEHTSKKPTDHRSFAYESDHLVCTIPIDLHPDGWEELDERPHTFELQVRTLAMHAWAEPEHDITYKPGSIVLEDERRKLAWAAASAWGIDEIFDQVTSAIDKRKTPSVPH